MSDLLKLMKLRYINFCRINELKHGNDPKLKKQLIGMIIGCVFLIFVFASYALIVFNTLAEAGMLEAITPLAYMSSIAIIFVFSLFRAAGVLYDKGTFNILVPMPIAKTTIVAERFLSMYFEDFLFGLGIMGLAFFVTATTSAITVTYVVTTLIATVFLPLLPLTISALFGSALSAIGGRMKHKNAVKTVLSLVLCFGIIGLNFYTSGLNDEQLGGIYGNIAKAVNGAFVSEFFIRAAGGDFIPFLLLLLGEIFLFAVTIFIAGKFFISISASMTESYSGKKFRKREMKEESSFVALLKREIKMYFSCSAYVVNTLMGSVLCVAGCVALIFFKENVVKTFAAYSISPVLLVVAAVYILTLAPASSSAISLEGKTLYILKTLPVREKEVYKSKIAVSLIILLPGLLSCSIILPVLFANDVFDVLAFVFIPVSAVLFSVVSGLRIGQRHYNLKWKYEAEVVKRGSSTLFSMLVGFITTAVTFLFLFFVKPVWIGTIAITVASVVVSAIIYKSALKVPLAKFE